LVSDGSTEFITAIVGDVVTILVVGLSYVSSKKNETNVNIRQKKQERYDELVEALTTIVKTLWTNEKDMDAFILAYNKTSAYASDEVVNACQAFFIHLINKEKDDGMLTKRVNEIYNAIRKDINPKAKPFRLLILDINFRLQSIIVSFLLFLDSFDGGIVTGNACIW
jgi:hypothetical protein